MPNYRIVVYHTSQVQTGDNSAPPGGTAGRDARSAGQWVVPAALGAAHPSPAGCARITAFDPTLQADPVAGGLERQQRMNARPVGADVWRFTDDSSTRGIVGARVCAERVIRRKCATAFRRKRPPVIRDSGVAQAQRGQRGQAVETGGVAVDINVGEAEVGQVGHPGHQITEVSGNFRVGRLTVHSWCFRLLAEFCTDSRIPLVGVI